MKQNKTVSVFGGSTPRPGDSAYKEAEELGRLLAEAGYSVMTGGYGGTMEAVSKGAKEAGGHVIGVTVEMFEEGGLRAANQYVDEVIRYETLSDRLMHLVTQCDAAVALRGGIGTLSEVALTWSLLQVREIETMPFVLVGDEWQDVLMLFYGTGRYIQESHMQLWACARTPEDVMSLLKDWS